MYFYTWGSLLSGKLLSSFIINYLQYLTQRIKFCELWQAKEAFKKQLPFFQTHGAVSVSSQFLAHLLNIQIHEYGQYYFRAAWMINSCFVWVWWRLLKSKTCLGGRHQGTSLPHLSTVQDESFWVVSPSLPLTLAPPRSCRASNCARRARRAGRVSRSAWYEPRRLGWLMISSRWPRARTSALPAGSARRAASRAAGTEERLWGGRRGCAGVWVRRRASGRAGERARRSWAGAERGGRRPGERGSAGASAERAQSRRGCHTRHLLQRPSALTAKPAQPPVLRSEPSCLQPHEVSRAVPRVPRC